MLEQATVERYATLSNQGVLFSYIRAQSKTTVSIEREMVCQDTIVGIAKVEENVIVVLDNAIEASTMMSTAVCKSDNVKGRCTRVERNT